MIIELYLNGIQRASFIPCIELIKSSLEVIHLSSPIDYRDRQNKTTTTNSRFINPINVETDKIIDEKYHQELCETGKSEKSPILIVMGRPIKISKGQVGNCSQFTFSELFQESKSAADYIKICESFPKIFITKIQKIKAENMNEIRRFITFIDQVYELKVQMNEMKMDIVDHLICV